MAAPYKKPINVKIAEALTTMNAVEVNGIVRGPNMPGLQRKLLRDRGFLEEIIKGWYYVSNPLVNDCSTAWMVHFWAFLSQYLESRFGDDYCLSSEASLRVQSGLTAVPTQISVIVTRHDNNLVQLPNGKIDLSDAPSRTASESAEGERRLVYEP